MYIDDVLKNMSEVLATSDPQTVVNAYNGICSTPIKYVGAGEYVTDEREIAIREVCKKFYETYTDQFQLSAGEEIDGKLVIWFYHSIQGDNIGVYLENGEIKVYERR